MYLKPEGYTSFGQILPIWAKIGCIPPTQPKIDTAGFVQVMENLESH